MNQLLMISDRFDLGDRVVVTCNATQEQRQAISAGARVTLVTASGEVCFDELEAFGSVDRSEFLSGPSLKNIGLSFHRLTSLAQLPEHASVKICFEGEGAGTSDCCDGPPTAE